MGKRKKDKNNPNQNDLWFDSDDGGTSSESGWGFSDSSSSSGSDTDSDESNFELGSWGNDGRTNNRKPNKFKNKRNKGNKIGNNNKTDSFSFTEDKSNTDDFSAFFGNETKSNNGILGKLLPKTWKGWAFALVLIIIVIGVGISVFSNSGRGVEANTVYDEIDNVLGDIRAGDAENLYNYIDVSYLAKDWDYFNKIEERELFYKNVLSVTRAEYNVDDDLVNNRVEGVVDVPVNLTHIHWGKIINDMKDFDFEKIQTMYSDAGIKKSDYEFNKELTTLFTKYINSLEELPTMQTETTLTLISQPVDDEGSFSWQMESDVAIDKIVFSNENFRNATDVFAGIATGDIGTLETNPNYTKWENTYNDLMEQLEDEVKNFEKYNELVTNKDGTVLYKDENGETIEVVNIDSGLLPEDEDLEDEETSEEVTEEVSLLDKAYAIAAPRPDEPEVNIVSGVVNQIENMLTNQPLPTHVKPKQAKTKEWKEWDKLTDYEKEEKDEPKKNRDVALPKGTLIPYTWVGAYYLYHEYEVDGEQVVIEPELGDGTFNRPVSYNTPVVTVMPDEKGNFHDVKLTIKRVFTGSNATDYAVSFDDRNRGFDTSSDRQLLTIEFEVENLEDKDLELSSEITLSDKDANVVSRTGSMYSFAEKTTIKPGETKVMQDWVNATNLDTRYLIWGNTFEREYQPVWIRVLEGTFTEGDDGVTREVPKKDSIVDEDVDYEDLDTVDEDIEDESVDEDIE